MSKELVNETDDFLHNPPDIIDFRSFRKFYTTVIKCIVRGEIDPNFPFTHKGANTLAYVGTVVLLALEREKKEGSIGEGLEEKFKELVSQGNLELTSEQCTLVLKQQEAAMAMKLIIRFASENAAVNAVEIVDVDPEPLTRAERQIAGLKKIAKEQDEDQYAF